MLATVYLHTLTYRCEQNRCEAPKTYSTPPTALTVHAIWLKIKLWVPIEVLFNVTVGFIQFSPLGRDMGGNVPNFGPVT